MHASEKLERSRVAGGDGAEGATWGRVLVAVAFFTYFFVFVWWYVDTRLLYHGDMVVLGPEWRISFPWFHTGWDFFRERAVKPGGLADYTGALLAQYFYYPMAGALVYTLLAAVIFSGTIGLGGAIRARGSWTAAYGSALGVLGMAGAYAFPLAGLVSVAAALLAVGLYAMVASRGSRLWVRMLTYAVLCLLAFWLTGASCLVVAIGCGLIEWRQFKRGWLGLMYLAVGFLVVVAGMYLYLMNRSDEGFLFSWPRFGSRVYRTAFPVGVYSGQVVLMIIWSWYSTLQVQRREKKLIAGRVDRPIHEQWFFDALGIALLAGAALLVSFGILDTEARPLLQANYLARMGQWAAMLEEITLHPPAAYPPCLLYDINRALYETGQLPDRMFSFPQDPQYLIQYGMDAVPHRGCQALLMALGCVNEAEQTACEALEVRGPLPYVLRELIMINILKERPEAARVFLRLLSRDVIHRRWAQDCLRRLADDPRLDSDDEVARLRQVMLREDRISLAGYDLFDLLLEHNPRNRMAFEYRMAFWLLTCQLEKFGEQVPALGAAGFTSIPQNYAEAILLHGQVNGQQTDLGGLRIDAKTTEHFRRFVELTRSRTRDSAALARLASGTYYEYFFAYNATAP